MPITYHRREGKSTRRQKSASEPGPGSGQQPRPGSIVAASRVVYQHLGIMTERGTVIANSGTHGRVVELPLKKFSLGLPVADKGYPGDRAPEEVIAEARSRIGERYNLFKNNCEHFATGVHGLEPHSPQIKQAAAIFGACVVVYGLLRARR